MSVIVCGVDGSEHAERALVWAYRQAALTGASLRVVACWEVPMAVKLAPLGPPAGLDLGAEAATRLHRSVVALRAGEREVEIDEVVLEGHPVDALMRAATGAQLLVVGSTGHGELAGVVLGSVALHAATHAPCPVVIVRPTVTS